MAVTSLSCWNENCSHVVVVVLRSTPMSPHDRIGEERGMKKERTKAWNENSRVSDQNGVSPLYTVLEIHHSGREPPKCS